MCEGKKQQRLAVFNVVAVQNCNADAGSGVIVTRLWLNLLSFTSRSVRIPLCDARVRPSKGEDISDEWLAVTCHAVRLSRFPAALGCALPRLADGGNATQSASAEASAGEGALLGRSYASTFEEFRSLAHWVPDDPDSGDRTYPPLGDLKHRRSRLQRGSSTRPERGDEKLPGNARALTV